MIIITRDRLFVRFGGISATHGRKMGSYMTKTIENFWKARLPIAPVRGNIELAGWSGNERRLSTFKEAPLGSSAELPAGDPLLSSIILVSAPGAVGKSTLARQIAAETGSIYIDLAKADPVGGNTISGGLFTAKLGDDWNSDKLSLLIDGLDEARLRVTQESFAAFLADVARLAKDRTAPTVLFGRTGAVQDAWFVLSDHPASTAILEIGFYGLNAATDFAMAIVEAEKPASPYRAVEQRAVGLLLQKIREQTSNDGDRFAGYAPVLQAVARRVLSEDNNASLIAEIEKGSQPVTLQTVVSSILNRERGKLSTLQFEDAKLTDRLYTEKEQLDRVVAHMYRTEKPAFPPMSPNDLQIYSTALENWVADHPFLNGAYEASSTVFDAVLCAHALKSKPAIPAALQRQLDRGGAANPFLVDFYLSESEETTNISPFVPPEHIGVLYASFRARLSLGDTANLTVEGVEDGEDEDLLNAEVEIILARGDRASEPARSLTLRTEQAGVFRMGNFVSGVTLDIPYGRVEIGSGREASLNSPISIQCDELTLAANRIVVEAAGDEKDGVVYLGANKFHSTDVLPVPSLRGSVRLSVQWPNVQSYPWTNFVAAALPPVDERIAEGLRRFRKFVIAFRSHSKGELARVRYKLEHERMTKGVGLAVLNHMKTTRILTQRGAADPMYILNPDRLGEISGATYAQCMAHEFNEKTIEFVRDAIT
jgi:hypothetical protein